MMLLSDSVDVTGVRSVRRCNYCTIAKMAEHSLEKGMLRIFTFILHEMHVELPKCSV